MPRHPWEMLRIHGNWSESIGTAQHPWERLSIHGNWSESVGAAQNPWEPLSIPGNPSASLEAPQHPQELPFLSPSLFSMSVFSKFAFSLLKPRIVWSQPTRSSLSEHGIPGNLSADGFNCLGSCVLSLCGFFLDTSMSDRRTWDLSMPFEM